MDIALTLTRKFPNELWILNGENYDNLEWLSDTPKPSKATLDGLWQEVQDTITSEAEAKAQAKAELLERLGITADEAKLLLA